MSMSKALRQMPAAAGRACVVRGEAACDPTSDEACDPRHDKPNTGSGLLGAALFRENLQQAWKRVKANKGADGVGFKVMWRPEEIKVLSQTRRCALNPARRLGYVHAVLG